MAPPRTRFARVVERDGWTVEMTWDGSRATFEDRESALESARRQQPDWIEIGELAPPTGDSARRHRWRTLRRRPDGGYEESGLRWGTGQPGG